MLTHIDKNQNPNMVDIHHKNYSSRMAVAKSQVQLPEIFRNYIKNNELIFKKGPVFQTAIIAATMAVKKTAEIIPFCHQLPIDDCKVEINLDEALVVTILCSVKTVAKTGVEMEALHGASVAALAIYDMCKAISSEMIILKTELIKKLGGKKPYLGRKTYGLVLTGGKSQRMNGQDKALIPYYENIPHGKYLFDLLKPFCDEVFLSAKNNQWNGTSLSELPILKDAEDMNGPMAGIISALQTHPNANWLVVACDLPFINQETLNKLFWNFNEQYFATCFTNKDANFPEPLCAIYTPRAINLFQKYYQQGINCPVKVLKAEKYNIVESDSQINLANINSKSDWENLQHEKS